MVRCSISSFIYNLIPPRLFLHLMTEVLQEAWRRLSSQCLGVMSLTHRSIWGVPAVMVAWQYSFLDSFWHFSPRVPHCCWKQKLLSNFQTQSSALWASTGRTGSTSLAAAALASCLPWIGTSRDCLRLPVSLS